MWKEIALVLIAAIRFGAMGVVFMIYVFKSQATIDLLITWLIAGILFALLVERRVIYPNKINKTE